MTATRTRHCLRGAATFTVTGPLHVLAGMTPDRDIQIGRKPGAFALAGPTHQMTEVPFLALADYPRQP
ncbi:hypothetical protein [Gemmobacter sp.]|uniref:hypothetical protein n=1 Tax=Gemmobacter sp. TaxID=1898957 RepID=UPI002AFDDF83|nr:hypothetical protein [Gemmobacter sp.]